MTKSEESEVESESCFHLIVKFYDSDYDSDTDSVTTENQPLVVYWQHNTFLHD